jgi:tRNA 2-thiouridine synthesizing protein E
MGMSGTDGYLARTPTWDYNSAEKQAATLHICLSPEHLEVVLIARRFYDEFGFSPSMRPLTKYVGNNLGVEKATSLYLLGLFPGSPARLVAAIAGLPKPKNCL